MPRAIRLLAATIVLQLAVGVSALALLTTAGAEVEPEPVGAEVEPEPVVAASVSDLVLLDPEPARSAGTDLAWTRSLQGTYRGAGAAFAPTTPSELDFAAAFPAHAAARQRPGDPASFHWAVIVGVNRYQRAGDTLGSVADAAVLHQELLRRGWHPDHVLVLTDEQATGMRIRQALGWLGQVTDDRSTVVFSMSGHIRHRNGVSALWPTDSDYIWADELGRLLAPIQAEKLWASLQGCHAEGLRAEGLEGPGRVITYSSQTAEKSYEDPEVGHSVMGNYLFREGFQQSWGDQNDDGLVSVQEAFGWAAPRASQRTAWQQTPVIADGLGRPFHLEIGS